MLSAASVIVACMIKMHFYQEHDEIKTKKLALTWNLKTLNQIIINYFKSQNWDCFSKSIKTSLTLSLSMKLLF